MGGGAEGTEAHIFGEQSKKSDYFRRHLYTTKLKPWNPAPTRYLPYSIIVKCFPTPQYSW